jgi:hypothetical protein
MGPSFFANDAHGIRIIGLNSSLLGSGLERENDQWKMLELEFAKTNDTPKIVFMHYPLFAKRADEPGGVYWNVEPEPRKRLLEMFHDKHVQAVLTGHLHKPLTNHYEGILLYSTPPISFPLPKTNPLAWTLVTIWKDREPTIEMKLIDHK